MRELTDHIVPGDSVNHQVKIAVIDEPGAGGANHMYEISFPSSRIQGAEIHGILFQNGPIKEVGVNGLTHEALTAIIIDRLRSFQAGPFASDFNRIALAHFEQALDALQARTRERIARQVEGTHQQ